VLLHARVGFVGVGAVGGVSGAALVPAGCCFLLAGGGVGGVGDGVGAGVQSERDAGEQVEHGVGAELGKGAFIAGSAGGGGERGEPFGGGGGPVGGQVDPGHGGGALVVEPGPHGPVGHGALLAAAGQPRVSPERVVAQPLAQLGRGPPGRPIQQPLRQRPGGGLVQLG
jgi:hypothetical protein